MSGSVTIREYEDRDRADVLNLITLNTPKYFAPEERGDLAHYLDHERELYYVILFDGYLIGCGGINLNTDKTVGRISWDILHPGYQGKALGSHLLLYRIQKMKAFPNMAKIIVKTSQLAYRFYEKNGFKVIETIKDHWAKGFDLYYMEYGRNNGQEH